MTQAIIDTLPTSQADVNAMPLANLIQTVVTLAKPDTLIQNQAVFHVNLFLSAAAVRMAKALYKTPEAGLIHRVAELDDLVQRNVEIG